MSTARGVFFAGAGLRGSMTTPSPEAGPHAVRRWSSGMPRVGCSPSTARLARLSGRSAESTKAGCSRWRSTRTDRRSPPPARTVESWSGVPPRGGSAWLSMSGAIGWRTWRGRRTENGWQPRAPGRFTRMVRMDRESGGRDDHPSTVSAIAWSSAEELATACYGRVAFFDGSTGKLRQKLEWIGSWCRWY